MLHITLQFSWQQILIQSFLAGGEKLINPFFRVWREVMLGEEGPLLFLPVLSLQQVSCHCTAGKGQLSEEPG